MDRAPEVDEATLALHSILIALFLVVITSWAWVPLVALTLGFGAVVPVGLLTIAALTIRRLNLAPKSR